MSKQVTFIPTPRESSQEDLVDYIKQESVKCPTNINLANRNLTRLAPEIGLLQNLERFFEFILELL
jgi:hypothetical protein